MALFALVAVLAFAFTMAFAHDRLMAIIMSVPVAALFSGWMFLILAWANKGLPPPRRIGPDQLPPALSIWKAHIASMVVMSILGIAIVVWSLSMHEYFAIGFLLGSPIAVWNEVRKAKRTEYELHGILWTTTGFAWTSKSRIRYLVPRE